MIIGMSFSAFTTLHVVISLVAMAAGFVVSPFLLAQTLLLLLFVAAGTLALRRFHPEPPVLLQTGA